MHAQVGVRISAQTREHGGRADTARTSDQRAVPPGVRSGRRGLWTGLEGSRRIPRCGGGGEGEVWLPSAASDEEHAQRLRRAEREARNAARLRSHPHIVTLHDVVIEDQAPWIVMELVDGGTLAERILQNGPLEARAVALAAKGLLEALGTAHASGIVHWDVKPANVMFARDGRVLLTDFGIAVKQGDTALTMSGGLMG
ncbi:serine/threonine-protein kinase [Nonomuraea wenchangensis]|uniref:serine/threonine-protein kinase n=1 Tax=Nonomuraea wenchangensis TaxID=568860 RepID=UPI00331CF31B